jgi:hypothetical protein
MKKLQLTLFSKVPNEKGIAKINKANSSKPITDEHGHDAEWYRDLNLPVPKELEEDGLVDGDGYINLEEDDLDVTMSLLLINLDDFSSAVDDEEYTHVYTKSGVKFDVHETVFEINEQIDELNKNKLIKFLKQLWQK